LQTVLEYNRKRRRIPRETIKEEVERDEELPSNQNKTEMHYLDVLRTWIDGAEPEVDQGEKQEPID